MAAPLRLLAARLLPLVRGMTAWLEAAATPAAPPPAAAEARLAALRARYPDAPEAWLAAIAERIADGDGLVTEAAEVPVEPESRTEPPTPAATAFASDPARPATRHAAVAPRPAAAPRPRPSFRTVAAPAETPAPAFPAESEAAPAPPPAWPVQKPAKARRIGFAVRPEPASVEPAPTKPAPPPRRHVRPRFLEVVRPLPGDAASIGRPAATPRDPAPLMFPPRVRQPAAEAPAPQAEAAVARPRPNLRPPAVVPRETPARAATPAAIETVPPVAYPPGTTAVPREVEFPRAWRDVPRARLAVQEAAADRWPALAPQAAAGATRRGIDGARLERLIRDQVERSWNG